MVPYSAGSLFPDLGLEPPPYAGGNILSHGSGFYKQGTRPAEGVVKGAVRSQPRELEQRGGQGLLDGRRVGHGPVAPLMESCPAGIYRHAHLVLHYAEPYPVGGAVLSKPVLAVAPLQALHHGLFDYGLAVGYAVQPAVKAAAGHRKSVLPAQVFLPGQGLDPLEQFLKAFGVEIAHEEAHPLRKPAAEVHPGQNIPAAREYHPAVLRPDLLTPHVPQLLGQQALNAQQAGCGIRHFSSGTSRP